MGLDIERVEFSAEEYEEFAARLGRSLEVLSDLLARPGFGVGARSLGAELEVSLVDAAHRPLPINREVLSESMDPRLTVELDRFNLESNLRHGPLAGHPFRNLEDEMNGALAEMRRAAGLHDAGIAMIGILPTLTASDLESEAMTEAPRYRALSAGLSRLRNEPFQLRIRGVDELALECHDVTYEGAATSLQVHLRVDPAEFARVYNAIQLSTPVVLAVSGNSPTFLGRRLWAETRVALFKQAVDHRQQQNRPHEPARVSFGERWIDGPLDLFRENVERHPVLLPVLDREPPPSVGDPAGVPGLRELRMHQGTVWRWNRAIYDPAEGGHLRIEMRALPAGPTVSDMLANTAFHLGLALSLADSGEPWTGGADFDTIHRDFYAAARDGLEATLHWPESPGAPLEEVAAPRLIERLLPIAQAGLDRAGVDLHDSARRLETIAGRAASGQTGARWQQRALAACTAGEPAPGDFDRVFARYLDLSRGDVPVHTWPEFSA